MHHDLSASLGGNATLLSAFLRAIDTLEAAETAIDELGGSTETTYENLAVARAALHAEIAALVVWDACSNLEARP